MNTTNQQVLQTAKFELLKSNYEKIEISNNFQVLKLKVPENNNIIIEYTKEINALRSNPLDKIDIINLKKYASFYKYWLDLNKKTITLGSTKYNIYKVKGCIYFRNIKSGSITNATKEFALAKIMNRLRPAEVVMNTIKKCQIKRKAMLHEK